MARRQMQQQRTVTTPAIKTKTVTETAAIIDTVTSVKQSVEIVQTLVHGSISSLLYMRKLLPRSCFVEQSYAVIRKNVTYKEYASGNSVRENTVPEKDPGWAFKSLRRGKSTRADRLLDWLEKGVFDALHQGYLRSLQISITENADQLSNVLELYTYTFHYKNPAAVGDTYPYSDVEMTGPGGVKVTVRTARTAMTDMVRSLVDLCGTMPRLPESRFVRLHLFYNENVPKFYEPEGFAPSMGHSIFFPEGTCQKVTVRCGEADSGFHTVYLKVSHLRADDAVDDNDEDEPEDRPPNIPIQLAYKNRVSRLEDIEPARVAQSPPNDSDAMPGIESTNEFNTPMAQQVRPIMARPKKGLDIQISTPSTVNFADMDLDLPLRMSTQCPGTATIATPHTAFGQVQVAATLETSPVIDTPRASTYTATPFSVAEELITTKGALQQMLRPSAPKLDTQETQQRAESVQEFVKPHALQLSQTTVQQLEIRRNILIPPRTPASSKDGETAGSIGAPDKVECQCGWDGEEDDMVHCDYCDTWQHLHCYGYRGTADSRIPNTHACYVCLLQGREDAVLRQLRGLALLRRGIHTLETRGFESIAHFRAVLDNCELSTASKLIQHFRSQKLVSFGKRLDFVSSEENNSLVMAEYFNPTSKIVHHFELPPSPMRNFHATLMETQYVQGNGRGDSSDTARQPNAEEASAVATPIASRLSSKRSRHDDHADDHASALKRVKSSATEPLGFGDFMTPSPGPTGARS